MRAGGLRAARGCVRPGTVQPGKQTTFAYDGFSRRTAITSTPAGGGSAVTTSYLWCSSRLCQARNAANAPTRGYYAEGEFVPGTPPQSDYYGADQLGSVRRTFVSTTSAPPYSYDPYGNALQTTAPLTDFGYAGMFYNADSGLYLAQYRAYNPAIGRWLSRDPLGERSNQYANLYTYVGNDPVSNIDPSGEILLGSNIRMLGFALRVVATLFFPSNPDLPGGPPSTPTPTQSDVGQPKPPASAGPGPKPPSPEPEPPSPEPGDPCDSGKSPSATPPIPPAIPAPPPPTRTNMLPPTRTNMLPFLLLPALGAALMLAL